MSWKALRKPFLHFPFFIQGEERLLEFLLLHIYVVEWEKMQVSYKRATVKKGMGVESTWTMDHLVHHNPPQRAILRRNLRTNHTVEVVAAQETAAALQDDEDVGVRQPPLLPLHSHQVALHFSENPLLHQLVDQPLQPLLEDAGHQVRSVIGCLTGQQII